MQYIDTEFYQNQDTSVEFVTETLDLSSTLALLGLKVYTAVIGSFTVGDN